MNPEEGRFSSLNLYIELQALNNLNYNRTDMISIVFDLDNTIVDNSIRKHQIIKNHIQLTEVTLEEVRADYSLKTMLGDYESAISRKFFEKLSSEEGIKDYKASLYESCQDSLEYLSKGLGLDIVVLTSRPKKLRAATENELRELGVFDYVSELIMPEDPEFKLEDSELYKKEELKTLMLRKNILTFVGDRPDDINAGIEVGLPTILFESNQIQENFNNPAGHYICKNWQELKKAILSLYNGNDQILLLRSSLINQYASFLSDLDGKARINATFGIGLAALSAGIINHGSFSTMCWLQCVLIIVAFALAILSIVFSINSMTSRYTSGFRSGIGVKTRLLKQICYGFRSIFWTTKKYYLGDDDPRKEFDELFEKDEVQQSVEHYRFFYEKYKTQNSNALMNLRLFELRAANYSKVYPEIISSKLLKGVVLCLFLWVILSLFN